MPLLFFPASGEILPEPLGTVLIFSSWNFPICEPSNSRHILPVAPVLKAMSGLMDVIDRFSMQV